MKRPSDDALDLAADWVEAYSPGAEDAATLSGVADWLRHQAAEERKAAFVRAHVAVGWTRAGALRAYRE